MIDEIRYKQSVALTGRNRTGPPRSVGRLTAGNVTDDDRRQTPASKTILAH